MKRNGKRNYYIIALFGIILSLAVGYALFAEQLSITGTATSSGTFDVEFTTATVGSSSLAGTPTAVISADKNTLTLTASTLTQPGAFVTYNVTVTNVGSIPAKLKAINVTGNTDPELTVTTPTFTSGTVINNGQTYVFNITVDWPIASTVGSRTVNYTVTLNYQQAQ